MAHEDHNFNRRRTDANVLALATRVGSLEGRIEVLEAQSEANGRELVANTRLTQQVHEAVFGVDDQPGLHAKVGEMHEVFTTAKNGFELLTKMGNFAVKAAETAGKVAKPLFWLVALVVAIFAYFKTGHFAWPEWQQ